MYYNSRVAPDGNYTETSAALQLQWHIGEYMRFTTRGTRFIGKYGLSRETNPPPSVFETNALATR